LKELYNYQFSFSCIFEYYYGLIDKVITNNEYLLTCDLSNLNNDEVIGILTGDLQNEIINSIDSTIQIGLPLEYLTKNEGSKNIRLVVSKWLYDEIGKRNFI